VIFAYNRFALRKIAFFSWNPRFITDDRKSPSTTGVVHSRNFLLVRFVEVLVSPTFKTIRIPGCKCKNDTRYRHDGSYK
jgi:hypothetical protein